MIQFLYGEDGLAGEHIEDLSIDLLKQDNKTVEAKHLFLPRNMTARELEDNLKKSMESSNVEEIIQNP